MSDEVEVAELPLESAGARLLRAREAGGITRLQLAAITKIPERHLGLIEQGDFAALPGKTYAVGFSRSYARAVGLNEIEIAAAVRAELAEQAFEPVRRGISSFEPGDPARVPSARFAWLAALMALLVVIAGLIFWRGYYAPRGELPSILASATPAPPANVAAPLANGETVVFTALEPAIWVKFYDGAGNQLLQKELARGERYTVPGNIADVRLWTARPEALAITIGGQPVPKLAEEQGMLRDVPVTAAALLGRQAPAIAPSVTPQSTRPEAPKPRATTRPITQMVRPTEAVRLPDPSAAAAPQPAASASAGNADADR